jgi:hypothetical protein
MDFESELQKRNLCAFRKAQLKAPKNYVQQEIKLKAYLHEQLNSVARLEATPIRKFSIVVARRRATEF